MSVRKTFSKTILEKYITRLNRLIKAKEGDDNYLWLETHSCSKDRYKLVDFNGSNNITLRMSAREMYGYLQGMETMFHMRTPEYK